jgi:hypothetical protein
LLRNAGITERDERVNKGFILKIFFLFSCFLKLKKTCHLRSAEIAGRD